MLKFAAHHSAIFLICDARTPACFAPPPFSLAPAWQGNVTYLEHQARLSDDVIAVALNLGQKLLVPGVEYTAGPIMCDVVWCGT